MRKALSQGFTTIELLVTATLIVLIASAILSGIQSAHQSWRAGESAERGGEIDAAVRAISVLLEKALPVASRNGTIAPALVFAGRARSILFVYLSEGDGQWGGPMFARIEPDPRGSRKAVVLSSIYRPENVWAINTDEMQKADLIDGLDDIEFRYYGILGAEQQPAWHGEWLGSDHLPMLIGARITRTKNGRAQQVELVAGPRQS